MKKLILLPLFLLTLLSQPVKADEPSIVVDDKIINVSDVLKKIPGLKQGVAFDIENSKFNYLTTIGFVQYDSFGLSAGYSSDDKAVATLTYRLGGLRQFGIDTPVTNWIDLEVGVYGGYSRITGSNEFSWGPTLTAANIKF